MTTPDPIAAQVPVKKKRGCFFYGCMTLLVIVVVAVLTVFLLTWYVIHWTNKMVADYTDVAPMTLPVSTLPDADLKQLQARVAAFNTAVDAHSNTPPLVLTGPEIDALINNSSAGKDFKNHFYVTLDGDAIKGQISLPLDNFNKIPRVNLQGRYLNGEGTFKASLTNGDLFVSVQSLEVKGKPVPAEFLAALQQQNLAQGLNNNPNARPLEHYESVQVKDSTLIVKPKGN